MALDIGCSKTKTSKAVLLQISCFFGGKTVSTRLVYNSEVCADSQSGAWERYNPGYNLGFPFKTGQNKSAGLRFAIEAGNSLV